MKIKQLTLTVAAIALTIAGLVSCNKKDLVSVKIGLNSQEVPFEIDPLTTTGNMSLAEFNTYLNVDSIIKANNASLAANFITSVKIVSCRITIDNGDNVNNFAVVQSAKAELSSNTKTEKVTVAELTNNPDVESYSLDLPVNGDLNLKDYFNATNFSYRISGNIRRTTNKKLSCRATIVYNLEAGF